MYTLYEIAQHIVQNKPYPQREFQQIQSGSQNAIKYILLMESTSSIIIKNVRNFVSGKLSEESIGNKINAQSAYSYLAAAKIVDLDTAPSEMKKSTYKIRELSLFASRPQKDGLGEITMLNAFSTPPLDQENLDILLANQIDNLHPLLKKAGFRKDGNGLFMRMNTYCQKNAQIIPTLVPILEAVMKERVESMLKIASLLPIKTIFIYRGCSGSGKSFFLRQFTKEYIQGISAQMAIQSTDNIKQDIKSRTNSIFTDQHVHLLGHSTFMTLSEAVTSKYPGLSTIQEGWFNTELILQNLFKNLSDSDLKSEIHDFDGDYEALCLRVLARYPDKDSPKPPLTEVERSFKTCRATRPRIIELLRPEDRYFFHYVYANGHIEESILPLEIESNSEAVDAEVEVTKKITITQEHIKIFGQSLNPFVGMKIEDAFDKVEGTYHN